MLLPSLWTRCLCGELKRVAPATCPPTSGRDARQTPADGGSTLLWDVSGRTRQGRASWKAACSVVSSKDVRGLTTPGSPAGRLLFPAYACPKRGVTCADARA